MTSGRRTSPTPTGRRWRLWCTSKAEGVPLAEEPEAPEEAEVVDLVAALRASVEAAKKRREEAEQAKAM